LDQISAELFKSLLAVSSKLTRAIVIVDGFDEFNMSGNTEDFRLLLRALKCTPWKIFLTSRTGEKLASEEFPAATRFQIREAEVQQDIRRYIRTIIGKDQNARELLSRDPQFKDKLIQVITERAGGR
jgi:hypothetical protein